MKAIEWLGSTHKDIMSFPKEARKELGFNLQLVQKGLEPMDWKPMRSVGMGVKEIRVHVGDEYRVIYVATYGAKIYALHAFQKKSRKTTKRDIQLAKDRFKLIVNVRR